MLDEIRLFKCAENEKLREKFWIDKFQNDFSRKKGALIRNVDKFYWVGKVDNRLVILFTNLKNPKY
jgi:hypothetical protein